MKCDQHTNTKTKKVNKMLLRIAYLIVYFASIKTIVEHISRFCRNLHATQTQNSDSLFHKIANTFCPRNHFDFLLDFNSRHLNVARGAQHTKTVLEPRLFSSSIAQWVYLFTWKKWTRAERRTRNQKWIESHRALHRYYECCLIATAQHSRSLARWFWCVLCFFCCCVPSTSCFVLFYSILNSFLGPQFGALINSDTFGLWATTGESRKKTAKRMSVVNGRCDTKGAGGGG